MGFFLPPSPAKNFKLLYWEYQEKSWGTWTYCYPPFGHFLAYVSLSYGVANMKFRGGDREGRASRPLYSDVFDPEELEYVC